MNFNPNILFSSSTDPNYYLYSYLNVLKDNLDFQLSRMIQLNQNLIMSQTCNQNSNSVKQEHNENESNSNSEQKQKIKISQNECYRTEQQKSAQLQTFGDRNDTKNIPKNYGKAILTFIKKNSSKIRPLLKKNNVEFLELMTQIKKIRKKVNSIQDLRKMWGAEDEQNKVKKCIRILSFTFMRKHCLPYIFHSRVKNYATHIKYRKRIIEGLKKPSEFTNIKQY